MDMVLGCLILPIQYHLLKISIKMNKNRIYFTAPSRSGSSLLVTLLNCLEDVVIINEPANSYRIDEIQTIVDVYSKLETEVSLGSINQRVNFEGEEVTDTYPNENLTWQKILIKYLTPSLRPGILVRERDWVYQSL